MAGTMRNCSTERTRTGVYSKYPISILVIDGALCAF